jgi:hypothetical protein
LLEWLGDIGRMTLGVIGMLVAATSAFFITYAAVELTAPGFQWGAVLYGLLVAATLFALTGGALLWRAMQGAGAHREERRRKYRQQDVLELAEELGGRVTVAEMALKLSYTVDEVREQLEAFVDEGIAEPGVSDSGREVYLFPEFWDENDKMTAEDPMKREFDAIFDEDQEVALGDVESDAAESAEREEAEVARQHVEREH